MAETIPGSPGEPASAAGSELQIPKHRFDEVAAEVRRLREEVVLKDQLYNQERMQRAQPQQTELTPEDTGLDQATHKAVLRVAQVIADRAVSKERSVFEQQIGMLASRTEKAELLASKGSGTAKYLPMIQQKQTEHYRQTGGFLPAEIALTMLQGEEKDEKIRQLEARLAGKPIDTQATISQSTATGGTPNTAATREIPGNAAAGTPGQKNFSEMTVEEMEAQLEKQFGGGTRL